MENKILFYFHKSTSEYLKKNKSMLYYKRWRFKQNLKSEEDVI